MTGSFCGSSLWLFAWGRRVSSSRPPHSTTTDAPLTGKCRPSGPELTSGAKLNSRLEEIGSTSVSETNRKDKIQSMIQNSSQTCVCVREPSEKELNGFMTEQRHPDVNSSRDLQCDPRSTKMIIRTIREEYLKNSNAMLQ